MDTVIIVDPFSTGCLYAKAFSKRGIDCVAVISSNSIPSHFTESMIETDFIQVYTWNSEIINELRKINPIAVIAGCETAIYLTDYLGEKLELKGNPVSSSNVRRRKDEMQLALRDYGISYINSILINNIANIDKCTENLSDIEKYVIKPINSGGTDGVTMVTGKDLVRETLYLAEWNKSNDLGELNKDFIVQPFIEGPEYVVDLVAFDNSYLVASVCKYNKIRLNGCDFVYKDLVTLDPEIDELKDIINYAKLAAAALEIKIGPIHMELINSKNGPVMIEAGARLHGGVAPYLFNYTYSPNLLELSVDAYLGKLPKLNYDKVKLESVGKVCFFYSNIETEFKMPSKENLEKLSLIPEYLGHKYYITEGQLTPLTIDVVTCPGLFWLCSKDPIILEKRENEIRNLLWNYKQSLL
ncbi:MAG: ATP-grasp domain-containing protein [Clostridium sp.]